MMIKHDIKFYEIMKNDISKYEIPIKISSLTICTLNLLALR